MISCIYIVVIHRTILLYQIKNKQLLVGDFNSAKLVVKLAYYLVHIGENIESVCSGFSICEGSLN